MREKILFVVMTFLYALYFIIDGRAACAAIMGFSTGVAFADAAITAANL